MIEYEFSLKFELPALDSNADQFVDVLFESGCDDAIVGTGLSGRIALSFIREALSADVAVSSAIRDVKTAIPGVKLVEATPDFVGLSEIAELLGCTRQNARKILHAKSRNGFPSPVHDGVASIWHLAQVLRWMKAIGNQKFNSALLELSEETMRVNVTRQSRNMARVRSRSIAAKARSQRALASYHKTGKKKRYFGALPGRSIENRAE